jgi:uncharacterized protein (DUF427 family)
MPARALGELPPSSWGKNPGYVMDLDALPFRVRAEIGGETVVDSRGALVMFELGHAPVYYVPRGDVRMELCTRTDRATHCPYKGDASYWTIAADGTTVENAVWSFEDPYPEMAVLKDLLGVYWEKMGAWYHDDVRVDRPVEIAGRVNESNNFAKCYPRLAAEWHREKNARIQPYEFAADSNASVWWKNAAGDEWQARIKDRVLSDGASGSLPRAAE